MEFTVAPLEAGKVEPHEHFMTIITDDLKANMPVEGVYLDASCASRRHGPIWAGISFPDRKPR